MLDTSANASSRYIRGGLEPLLYSSLQGSLPTSRSMAPKNKISKGRKAAPDSVKANPRAKLKLTKMFQTGEVHSGSSFNDIYEEYPEFQKVAKEKFRRFFNTMKKTHIDMGTEPPGNYIYH